MRTRLSSENPFGWTRRGFLWQVLHDGHPTGRHLDFGGGDGSVAASLVQAGVVDTAVVVDANCDVVPTGEGTEVAGLSFVVVPPGSPLPFEPASFDSVSMLDVLEHIDDQAAVLAEMARVLRPGGRLVVTVPRRNVFSVLDTGNWKFRFPRLHRRVYSLLFSPEQYQRRYCDPTNGLFGDIEGAKMWHEHFTEAHLAALLRSAGFTPSTFDGSGLFVRLLALAQLPFVRSGRRPLAVLEGWDARMFRHSNLFSVAERSGAAADGGSVGAQDAASEGGAGRTAATGDRAAS